MRIYGRNSVIERLHQNPESIRKIFVQEGAQSLHNIRKKAAKRNIPVVVIPKSRMVKIARDINAQGVLIDVEDFEYLPYDDVLDNAINKKRTLLFLDGVTDPQNFGVIIRSLACLDKFSIIIPTHKSVSITETVLRVSSGGDNYIQVAKVPNIYNAIKKSRDQGFKIVGAVVEGGESLFEADFKFPLGLVIGSEQKGISERVKSVLDKEITIPMYAKTLSFNVAQAVSIICYEITKQKKS